MAMSVEEEMAMSIEATTALFYVEKDSLRSCCNRVNVQKVLKH